MPRVTMETQRARLASRLRPLYAGMRSDEFDCMVARIAEIELYGAALNPADVGTVSARRARDARSLPAVMAS